MPDELQQLRANIDRFPKVLTERLRAVAWRKSREVKAIASRLALRGHDPRGRLNEGEPHLADSIVIVEHAAKKEFLVSPETPWNPNLGLWIERGTSKMAATPFMRPAGDAVNASYQSEMTKVAEQAASEVLR